MEVTVPSGKLSEYDADIMSLKCRGCGAEPRNRCRSKKGNATGHHPIAPHKERKEDALKLKKEAK